MNCASKDLAGGRWKIPGSSIWDNRAAGFVTAAGTRGTAVARFRASGPVGDHFLKIYTGWQGQSLSQFPAGAERVPAASRFQVSHDAGSIPDALPHTRTNTSRMLCRTAEVHVANGKLSVSPTQGPVGTKAMLRGEGFPANSTLDLFWQTYIGSRVSGNGFGPQENSIAKVKVGSDGKIDFPLTVPEDLGGEHGIELREGEKLLGRAYFAIETTIVSMEPASGPAGTPITIHLKGVGWTEYDNMFAATYDNAYMGYACGFNSQGDVVIHFQGGGGTWHPPDRSFSGHLSRAAHGKPTAVSHAAAHLCRRSSGQQNSRAAFQVQRDSVISA